MAKADIHPKWYPDAKVYCNGQVVMTIGSTKPELHVDVWSGNHPFYTGTQKIIDTEGRVERFLRKYGMSSTQTSGDEQDKKQRVGSAVNDGPASAGSIFIYMLEPICYFFKERSQSSWLNHTYWTS